MVTISSRETVYTPCLGTLDPQGSCRETASPAASQTRASGDGVLFALRARHVSPGQNSLRGDCPRGLVYTQRLQCSSFSVMTYFWLRDYDILPKTGTTFKPLGFDYIGSLLKGY